MDILEILGITTAEQLSNAVVWFFVLAVFYGVMQMLLMIMLIANTYNTTKAVERLAKQMADYGSKDFDVS